MTVPWRWTALAFAALAASPAAGIAQERTRSPHGELALECSACHQPRGWTPVRISRAFDHARSGFPLSGAHAATRCRACHQSLDFKGTPATCAGCHEDVHLGELGADCARCHSPRSFLDRSAMWRAHQTTRFPLEGSHLAADCRACHTPAAQGRLQFVNQPAGCAACHLDAYQAARNPDHAAGGFPQDCAQCHAATLWNRARFNHQTVGFPLTGAHRALACVQCHVNNRYAGTAANCVSCHQPDYDATTSPAHPAARFSTDCTTCHTTVAWSPAAFDHTRTSFPLTGAHRTAPCAACHADGVYQGKTATCFGCHQADYTRAANPPHQTSQFPTDCSVCHSTVTWDGARFDHDAPYFPIYSGPHRGKWNSCATCHVVSSDYSQFTCFQCHAHDQLKMDSKHRGKAGYRYDSRECFRCHPRGRAD
jgi:hypothetical protein